MKIPDLRNPVGRLLAIGLLEGASFLVLVGVAMPLKYVWHMPEAVRIFGMAHGVLFLLFLVAIFQAYGDKAITGRQAGLAFVASLIPFAPFFLHRGLKPGQAAAAETEVPDDLK